jgi:hypothetical protein
MEEILILLHYASERMLIYQYSDIRKGFITGMAKFVYGEHFPDDGDDDNVDDDDDDDDVMMTTNMM